MRCNNMKCNNMRCNRTCNSMRFNRTKCKGPIKDHIKCYMKGHIIES